MTIFICLDDRGGIRFNGRRQSRDIRVLEDMAARVTGELWITPFSGKLFHMAGIPCHVMGDEPMTGEAIFLEEIPSEELLAQADTLTVYRWNRHYPADVRFDADLSSFTLQRTENFPGSSHETITKEVYAL